MVVAGSVEAGAATAGAVRIYGYPYASRCPTAGYAGAVDRWGMFACNCTSYVAWALAANGLRTDWFVPGAMDAWNWPHVALLAELREGTSPRVGAVAVWPRLDRPFGHVAFVTAVNPDGRFDVAEYNAPTQTWFEPYLFDVRTHVARRGAVFIYVPRRDREL